MVPNGPKTKIRTTQQIKDQKAVLNWGGASLSVLKKNVMFMFISHFYTKIFIFFL